MEGRKLWIVIIVLAVVLLGIVGTCCVGMGFLVAGAPQYELDVEAARREGDRAGASATTDACIEEGYARTSLCSTFESDCMDVARSYLLACLRAVPEPSPELCVGAPSHPGFLSDPTFTAALCSRYGWSQDDPGCGDVASSVETHCATNARE